MSTNSFSSIVLPDFMNSNKEVFKDLSAYYKASRSNPALLATEGKDFKVDSTSGRYQNTLDDIIDKLRSVQ